MTEHTHDVRLRLLVDAGIALSSELSLDALLQTIVETAAHLTDARYAALGVVDASGMALERFLTTGLDNETRTAIGDEPVGRGLLGAVIREAHVIRLDSIAHDPRSVGFPANHPPMTTFLGVPILLRGTVYGNLYLTDKRDGSAFTEGDEEVTRLLAAQAAVAIENARLHESSSRWLRQLESLNEIGNAMAAQIELDPLLGLVAARLRDLVRARIVLVVLAERASMLRIAAAAGDHADKLVGTQLAVDASKIGRVIARGQTERIDSVANDPEIDQDIAQRLQISTGMYIPLVVKGRTLGVIAAHDRAGENPRFGEDDLRLGESLGKRAAIAVDLAQRVSRDAVRRVVEAQELERARLARELHDETGQALASILLGLRSLEQSLDSEPALARVAAVRELVVSTLHDVRRLAVELRPAALDDFGLAAAIERLVDTYRQDGSAAVDLEIQMGEDRFPADVETTLYRIVQEALTNVTKHAQATRVSVLLTRTPRAAVLVVEDDGTGFEQRHATNGLGLTGMRERVALVGGRLRFETGSGGTTIAVEIPL
ncbi:MAG TPA: GAF domain-containing protein [Gaiellaceae bacterium]|nr:GAF domain-containing protein [Gaiellaceae bacterium]